jgi:hypothetical protein
MVGLPGVTSRNVRPRSYALVSMARPQHRANAATKLDETLCAASKEQSKRINDLGVTADGRGGVIATHQLVAQALK